VAENVEAVPTRVLPTRVPVEPTVDPNAGQPVAAAPTTAPTAIPPTAGPTEVRATLTPIPPTATRSFATATPNVTAVPGDPVVGKQLFEQGTGKVEIPTCASCHNIVDDGTIKVGPLMGGLVTRGTMHAQAQGQDLYTYLHTSIVNPNAFLVPNEGTKVYSAAGTSLMYQNYATDLTAEQIDHLVAYLLTLK
jgi:cytochrome c553